MESERVGKNAEGDRGVIRHWQRTSWETEQIIQSVKWFTKQINQSTNTQNTGYRLFCEACLLEWFKRKSLAALVAGPSSVTNQSSPRGPSCAVAHAVLSPTQSWETNPAVFSWWNIEINSKTNRQPALSCLTGGDLLFFICFICLAAAVFANGRESAWNCSQTNEKMYVFKVSKW